MDQYFDMARIRGIVERRSRWFVLPFICIFFLAVATALVLPDVFRSSAVIKIESPQITPELIASTAAGVADQRIQAITQEMISRTRVLTLVAKYDLLPAKREHLAAEDLVEMVRRRIRVEPIDAEIKKESRDRPILLTIAFKISYDDEDPRKAQCVTGEISSYYMGRNIEARERQAKTTSRFLHDQLGQFRERLDDLESRLAVYREEHLEELPEFTNLQMQKLEKLNDDLSGLNMQIRSMEEQRSAIKNRLAFIDPWSSDKVLTFEERLQQARLERISLVTRYTEDAPPVRAIDRQIAALEVKVRGKILNMQKVNTLRDRLSRLEKELDSMRQSNADNFLALQRKMGEIESLRKEITNLQTKTGFPRTPPIEKSTSNLGYVALKTDLEKVEVSIAAANAEKIRIEQQVRDVYGKLYMTPRVSKQYNELMTDYQNAKTHYTELQHKLVTARVAQGMEEEQLGETFQVVEPPFLPEKPVRPNRTAIVVVGAVLALGASVVCVSLVEFSDKSVRDPAMIEQLSGLRVLSVIPRIQTAEDRLRARRRRIATVVCCLLAAGVVFYFLMMDVRLIQAALERLLLKKIPY
ncbi:MAG: hypothetical protein AAGU11_02320 [Syntrophobacteraceae bacterium]